LYSLLTTARHIRYSPIGAAFKLLQGATMPNGQKYEDWLKDKKVSGKYEKNE
jgi:hypothetical protein